MSRFPANQFLDFFFDQKRELAPSVRQNLRQLLCAAKECIHACRDLIDN
jgi:hypothetical protein